MAMEGNENLNQGKNIIDALDLLPVIVFNQTARLTLADITP